MEISVRRSDGLILQYGQSLGYREDADIVALPFSKEETFMVYMRNGQPVTHSSSDGFKAVPEASVEL